MSVPRAFAALPHFMRIYDAHEDTDRNKPPHLASFTLDMIDECHVGVKSVAIDAEMAVRRLSIRTRTMMEARTTLTRQLRQTASRTHAPSQYRYVAKKIGRVRLKLRA